MNEAPDEKWKTLPGGFPEYEISNYGGIRTKEHKYKMLSIGGKRKDECEIILFNELGEYEPVKLWEMYNRAWGGSEK